MSKEPVICKKCGDLNHCDDHHILPETIFGDGETAPLCKTCHDKYHRFLGFKFTRKKNAQSKEFYLQNWLKWLSFFALLGIVYLICF